jgi:protein TonB
MDQPLHDLRPYGTGHANSHRMVSIGAVALFHIVAIYMLASGLAMGLLEKLPTELKADVIPPKQEVVKPPPPPPPDLQKPPPPFVPPPDISIQTEAAPTNTITVQSKIATPPPPQVVAPPKPAGITAPVALKSAHNCAERYYPPIAMRLNQEGTTRVRITVSADGQVTDAKVAESSGHDSLDEAAVKCVTSGSWGGYRPALQNGQPTAAQTEVVIKWSLK